MKTDTSNRSDKHVLCRLTISVRFVKGRGSTRYLADPSNYNEKHKPQEERAKYRGG